jgi:thymidylate kinase
MVWERRSGPDGKRSDRKLWVALEGPCCAGKTTLGLGLAATMSDIVLVRVVCYADHVGGGRFLPRPVPGSAVEDHPALQTLLTIDAERTSIARQTPCELVLLDRSVHTLLAHRHAIETVTGVEIASAAGRVVAASALAAWPDLVLFLDVPYQAILDRNRGKFPPDSIFVDATYNAGFRGYFSKLVDGGAADVVRLDATLEPEKLASVAEAHIRSLLAQMTDRLP